MTSAGECAKHAAECRVLARHVQDEEHRNQLLRMADAWDNFVAQKNGEKQALPSVKTEHAPEFGEA